jgi:hypothetical protein
LPIVRKDNSKRKMENLNKKIKLSNYFTEFTYEESNEERIKLLMEVILQNNLKGKKKILIRRFLRKTSVFLCSLAREQRHAKANAIFCLKIL